MKLKPSDLANQGRPGQVRTTFTVTGTKAEYSLKDSAHIQVSPAVIEAADQNYDGVAIFCRGVPRFTITTEGAIELYDRLGRLLDQLGL